MKIFNLKNTTLFIILMIMTATLVAQGGFNPPRDLYSDGWELGWTTPEYNGNGDLQGYNLYMVGNDDDVLIEYTDSREQWFGLYLLDEHVELWSSA